MYKLTACEVEDEFSAAIRTKSVNNDNVGGIRFQRDIAYCTHASRIGMCASRIFPTVVISSNAIIAHDIRWVRESIGL